MTALLTEHTLNLWGVALGIVTAVIGIIGVLVKTWLIPFLKTEVIEPLNETRHQVTVNHHSSDRPTVLDLISDARAEIADVKMGLADAALERAAIKTEVQTIRHTQDRVGTELKDHLDNVTAERAVIEKERIAMWGAIEAVAKSQPVETPIPVTVVDSEAGKGTD